MGQQQLLLTIVVTVIVALAIVMGISRFKNAAETTNIEVIRMDIVNFASNARAYYIKSPMYGGGGYSFEGITFRSVVFPAAAYSADNTMVANANAIYSLSLADTVITITAYPVTGISESSSGNNASEVALQRANSNSGIYVTLDNSVLQAEVYPNGIAWIE